jgi:hypothetical protein
MKTLDEQVLSAATGTLELFGLYLGDRLGLYEALADAGPVTVAELAERAGIHDRYAREWLEQAVSGVLAVDEPALPYDERRYRLPPEHAGVVADPTHGHHLLPLGRMVVGIAKALDEVVEAYRTGAGVPSARYGGDFRAGQGAINRPAFITALVDEWLPALGQVTGRLRAGGRLARVRYRRRPASRRRLLPAVPAADLRAHHVPARQPPRSRRSGAWAITPSWSAADLSGPVPGALVPCAVRGGRRRTGRGGRSTSGAGGRSARCHRSGSTWRRSSGHPRRRCAGRLLRCGRWHRSWR